MFPLFSSILDNSYGIQESPKMHKRGKSWCKDLFCDQVYHNEMKLGCFLDAVKLQKEILEYFIRPLDFASHRGP